MQRLLIGKVFDGTVVLFVPDSFPSSYGGTYNLLVYTSSKNTIYCEIRKEKINALSMENRGHPPLNQQLEIT